VRDGGRVVATAVALPYPPVFGWVSMVLVHTPYRRLGLATRLVERATAALTDAGLVAVLDATPAGAGVYGPMGFRPVANLMRWRGPGGAGAPEPAPAAGPDLDLDVEAFGADRSALLADLAARPAPISFAAGADGHLLSRAGRTGSQIGPLVARDAATAVTLLAEGLDTLTGTGIVDVPEHATAVAAHLAGRGFAQERPYVRMALGRDSIAGTPALVHAIAGPELG
jgi:hypothetical protein